MGVALADRRRPDRPISIDDPVAAARSAHLRYVVDTAPGYRRRRAGRHFTYLDQDGRPIRDPAERARIQSLAIPPAWTEVWICPDPRGHLQATGRDARGRKQYRYHPRWREVRDATKFDRTIAFGRVLPRLRARVEADLARPGSDREKLLAALVRLLETTRIRIGNEEYARDNGSYGLTTLRDQHAQIAGATVRFRFRGKSGQEHTIGIQDRRLARIVRRCRDLPGQILFQYLDDAGEPRSITSDDVNAYLREIAGEEFTAKDFRTWAGTVIAARQLAEIVAANSDPTAKQAIARAIEAVAAELGNTPAVCRTGYVHPAVIEAFLHGETIGPAAVDAGRDPDGGLTDDEAAVLRLLERSATAAAAVR